MVLKALNLASLWRWQFIYTVAATYFSPRTGTEPRAVSEWLNWLWKLSSTSCWFVKSPFKFYLDRSSSRPGEPDLLRSEIGGVATACPRQ